LELRTALLAVEVVIETRCFDCDAPYSGPDLACGPCMGRAYRAANADTTDAELMRLRWLGSQQRKQREGKKWQEALDAATGMEY
jgi:hypothetical protein